MQKFHNDSNLEVLEKELHSKNLTPAPPFINRDRLLFESGRAAARSDRHVRFLVVTTMLFAFSTISVGYLLVRQRQVNALLNQELAAFACVQAVPLNLFETKLPVARELPDSSYLALMRRSDLFEDQTPVYPSPPADSSPGVSPEGPALKVLHLRSRLDF